MRTGVKNFFRPKKIQDSIELSEQIKDHKPKACLVSLSDAPVRRASSRRTAPLLPVQFGLEGNFSRELLATLDRLLGVL